MINLNAILKHTKLTYKQLVDVSILAGCDYNIKLPQYGIVRIKNLIKEHGCIEAMIKKGFDVSMTNYAICRKYFMYPETYQDLCQNPDFSLNIDFSIFNKYLTLESKLKKFGLDFWMNRLGIRYQIMKDCKIIPIKTKNGIMNIKIRTNQKNTSLTNDNELCFDDTL